MKQFVNWTLKVKEQDKKESGNIVLKCMMSGRKKEDGTYEQALWMRVVIINTGDNKTEWEPQDLTDKYITVGGNFTHSDWESNGKIGKDFTIFATILDLAPEKEEKPKKSKSKAKY